MADTNGRPAGPIFDPHAPIQNARRHEWVTLDSGIVCVRELLAADSLFVLDRSVRQIGNGAEVHVDTGGLQIWQVVVSCYDGDGLDAKRIFEITDIDRIKQLRAAEWNKITQAIERVNGLADSEVAASQDFTPATGASSSATSRRGASKPCTASPVK